MEIVAPEGFPCTPLEECIKKRVWPVLTHPAHGPDAYNLIAGTDSISLRMLDWVCTNFSKAHALRLPRRGREPMYVFEEYLLQLDYFRRRNFDPFRRGMHKASNATFRIRDPDSGRELPTTLAQINFLAWAFSTGLLAFSRRKHVQIEAHMNRVTSATRRRRAGGRRAGRSVLSARPKTRCHVYPRAQ